MEDGNGKPLVFRDGMTENVRDLVDVVPRLDVFEDAALAEPCREVRDGVARVETCCARRGGSSRAPARR